MMTSANAAFISDNIACWDMKKIAGVTLVRLGFYVDTLGATYKKLVDSTAFLQQTALGSSTVKSLLAPPAFPAWAYTEALFANVLVTRREISC